MKITDKPVTVATHYDCAGEADLNGMLHNPTWRHNIIGCFLIEILRSMYNLNITYVIDPPEAINNIMVPDVDLFAVPFILSPQTMNLGHPIQAVLHARYGFLVRRPHDLGLWNHYYARPFTMPLWRFLFIAAMFICCLFFLAAWWEKRLLGGMVECNLGLEMLLIIGGYCQHIPPVEATFCSRRTAYFTFFLYSYIIYTVYTSNLLSHLVSDKEDDIGLDYLEEDFFEFAILENMKHILANDFLENRESPMYARLSRAETLSINPALNAVRWNRTALLSDYITVYPVVQAVFTDSEICDLMEIDLNSAVRKYIFASARFKYNEELKIGTLKAREAGILKKLTFYDNYYPLTCQKTLHQEVEIQQVFIPMMMLVASYGISLVILLLEKLHYTETRVWPYVN